MNNRKTPRDPETMLRDGEAIDRAVVAAQRHVVLRHRQTHLPLVVWRDGRVVELPADSVKIPEGAEPIVTRSRRKRV